MTINKAAVFQKKKPLPWREVTGVAVIVDVKNETVLEGNDAASFIWSFIDGKRSVLEIAKEVCESFEITEEEALQDTVELLEKLHRRGLLVEVKD